MIRKPSAKNRNLKLLLGITLGIAAALIVLLLFVPEKEGRSSEADGIVLYPNGETAACTVTLQGALKTYTFDQDAPIYDGTLLVDGETVGEVYLIFDGNYAVPKSDGVPAVMTQDMEIAAQIQIEGSDCLVLAPAADEATAQALLSRFLTYTIYARQQGWEAFKTE